MRLFNYLISWVRVIVEDWSFGQCCRDAQSTEKSVFYGFVSLVSLRGEKRFMDESTDYFRNPLNHGTKYCKMFTILADSFPSVLDEHERGTLHA